MVSDQLALSVPQQQQPATTHACTLAGSNLLLERLLSQQEGRTAHEAPTAHQGSVSSKSFPTPKIFRPVPATGFTPDDAKSESEEAVQKEAGACVSIAYNKPAKTGSTRVGIALKQQFPDAKRVACGEHNRTGSYYRCESSVISACRTCGVLF